MIKNMFYKRDGTTGEVSTLDTNNKDDFVEAFKIENRRIDHTEVLDDKTGNLIRVSTVFLGIDHNFGEGSPILYETMVFKNESFEDLYCKRYATEEAAKAGHLRIIEEYKNGTLELYSIDDEEE